MPHRLGHSLLKLIALQLKDYAHYYIFALITLILTHYIQSHLPFMAKEIADLIEKGSHEFPFIALLLLALGIILFRTSSRLLFFYPARVMQRNLRVEILEKLEETIPERYRNYSDGQIFQTVYNDFEQIRTLVGFALLQFGNIVIACAILIPKLSSLSPKLLIALSPMLITFLIFTLIVSNNRKYFKASQDMAAEVQNHIMESYKGKATIKNYQAEKAFLEIFRTHSFKELYNSFKGGISISISMPLIPLGVGLSLIWGAMIIKDLDLGTTHLITFSGFSFLFLEPLMFVSWIGVVTVSALASWKRIRELLIILETQSDLEKKLKMNNSDVQKKTEFEFNLNFWDKTLKVVIPKNKISVLIGKTGCGKSEILKQIALCLKQEGVQTSYVSQAPYLYNDRLTDNIFLGHIPTDEQLKQAKWLLELFELTYINRDLSELMKMEIGENGKRLSGGQSKRLALIRSLILPSQVIIWDDPFSSVDVILEKSIFLKLKESNIFQGKTVIMCGHRLTTVKHADNLIYLCHENDSVGILEQGSVEKLLSIKNGPSYEFFEKQMV
ncbi:MAG: ABC transporter ATP-binding protein [Halobacteriovoraceae bacterium]|nr:ABC transporter ATP-binding protein [Halobacteriovoraceae bacterium]